MALFACLATLIVGASAPASAQLDACGNIDIEAGATCEVEVEGGCMVQCEPLSFRAACAADLYVDCDASCTGEVTVECMASCDVVECSARCDVDPGSFDCRADCNLDASVSCEAECSARGGDGDAQAECQASCEGTFAANCDASCEVTAPSADCMAHCEASCQGSCNAESTLDCQVDCQAGGYVDCYAELQGGCEAECMGPEGALFCDGQYVDHGDNLLMCIDAIQAAFDITVDTTSMASCMDGMCTAEGTVNVGCAVSPGGRGAEAPLGVLALLGLALLRRRR